MLSFLSMFVLTVLQNASFTLVSRARNSRSLRYHLGAAVCSNGVYLLVIRQIIVKLDSGWVMLAYLLGSVSGSVLMHWMSMRFLEKNKPAKR